MLYLCMFYSVPLMVRPFDPGIILLLFPSTTPLTAFNDNRKSHINRRRCGQNLHVAPEKNNTSSLILLRQRTPDYSVTEIRIKTYINEKAYIQI